MTETTGLKTQRRTPGTPAKLNLIFQTMPIGGEEVVPCRDIQIVQRHMSYLRGRHKEDRWFICEEAGPDLVKVIRVPTKQVAKRQAIQNRQAELNRQAGELNLNRAKYDLSLPFTREQLMDIMSGVRTSFMGRVKPAPSGEYVGWQKVEKTFWHVWQDGDNQQRYDCPYGRTNDQIRPVDSSTDFPVYLGKKQLRLKLTEISAVKQDDTWCWICNFSKITV